MMNAIRTKLLLLVVLAAAPAARAQSTYEPFFFGLLAGGVNSIGADDGTGNAARFNGPQGVAVDRNGNAYVADTGNNSIRKITPNGTVSTFAGSPVGTSGSVDGTGGAARFELPQGVAVDLSGNVYVGDSGNNTIRKITPDGVVTTIAGGVHQGGSADGPGVQARFSYPIGVSTDAAGNVYVSDTGNGTIRTVTPGGVVGTLAGLAGTVGSDDGVGSAARFSFPMRVAYDNSTGDIYVADTGNHTIRKVTSDGTVTTIAGSPGSSGTNDGTGSAARFNGPKGLAVDGLGNVYVVSTNSDTVRKIRAGGIVTTLGGSPDAVGGANGVGANARFNNPFAMAADGAGNLHVTDTVNHTIRFGVPVGGPLPLNIAAPAASPKALTGHTFPNVTVDILATSDLASPFQLLATVVSDANGFFHYDDVASIKRFYRALVSTTQAPVPAASLFRRR